MPYGKGPSTPSLRPQGAGADDAERLAKSVGEIAARFAEHPGIQEQYAAALRDAAYAQAARPQGAGADDAERLAKSVGEIATRKAFAEHPGIQEAYAKAREYADRAKRQ